MLITTDILEVNPMRIWLQDSNLLSWNWKGNYIYEKKVQ